MASYRSIALTALLVAYQPWSMFALTPVSSVARRAGRVTSITSRTTARSMSTTDSPTEEKAAPTVIPNPNAYEKLKMEELVSLCKRRGFIFPSSEIYNGMAGFYDYGPLGAELKKNVKDLWWKTFVHGREDVEGLDSSIIHNPTTWQSSGHLDGFSDPMVDCKETKLRYRADQLFYAPIVIKESGERVGWVLVHEANDEDMVKAAKKQAKKTLKEADKKGAEIEGFSFKDLTEATEEEMSEIPSPASGKPTLTMPRDFNLMFQTNVGAMSDEASIAYLRPETAQGIFINFKNAMGTTRSKIPFGIAQIGKAFRNEITPRNFIFRSREFEQMEVEYFIPPGDDVWEPYHKQWMEDSKQFLLDVGLREDLLGWDVHEGDGLAHYARACTDITFRFPFGVQELMGIAARGNFDLTQHSEGSGKNLDYYCDVTKEKYIPHCIEPSLGVDRLALALICSAYAEDEVGGEKRNFLKFSPRVAPIKASVLPLLKNKEQLVSVARELYDKLRTRWNVSWDATGAIGRRYRRADEVGTPFCITIDFDTVEKDGSVTIRDRDTTEQVRIPMEEVIPYLSKQIDGY
uniref:glycine--tRNA ligase n=1 Tax=Helicotheca tamesis TaxID=374047 RepID=A0A7S2IHX4_9STRA|mmetsp:Transcript_9520/g.13281  ORF Transcript_9520/g.13281 Transcript_9520/m.13281 type:complete len:575 (+) Transcript_9520:180-1904(+)|eukprot:CAMPEP_0185731600 /NCGR_PEP_ID=MMETSP1171-20130828/13457_1 /TAXON_ID=374046 /ORGANISM="Helicotheca tamensis, Strain CCMP826" /LENGTH=574 /DNA_ID=CAMNT_0028400903 /DNA_START=132 /DNA_END=1856 /DNA_ORIENTATION=-